jgi:hypothetical protein
VQLGAVNGELKQQRGTNDAAQQQRLAQAEELRGLRNEVQVLTAVLASVKEDK